MKKKIRNFMFQLIGFIIFIVVYNILERRSEKKWRKHDAYMES